MEAARCTRKRIVLQNFARTVGRSCALFTHELLARWTDHSNQAAIWQESLGLILHAHQKFQTAWSSGFCLAVGAAHAAGVNSLIWVILAAGKRVNKSFKETEAAAAPGDCVGIRVNS